MLKGSVPARRTRRKQRQAVQAEPTGENGAVVNSCGCSERGCAAI